MEALEFEVLYFLQSLHRPWLDSFMTVITSLANGGMIWIVTGAGFLCFKKTRKMGFALLISLACGAVLGNLILKNLVGRDRPCWLDPSIALLIRNPSDFSFPSGHTLVSFEGAVSIWLYNRKWGAAALVLAVLIGFSRLYHFVHFPSDVLTGLIMGTAIAAGVHVLVERVAESMENKKIRQK